MTATAIQHHADDIADGLFRAVAQHPFDLRPRLVLADRLDEIGEPERAEFIRLQIEVAAGRLMLGSPEMERARVLRLRLRLYSGQETPAGVMYCDRQCAHLVTPNDVIHVLNNGFVEEVRCPLAWWVGQSCLVCQGTGLTGGLSPVPGCAACHGTGTTPGHGAEVVARHPVVKVVVSDREPMQAHDGQWYWYTDHGLPPDHDFARDTYLVPHGVFVRLQGANHLRWVSYPTREAAEAALSRALVDIARERAGLPAIQWEVTR